MASTPMLVLKNVTKRFDEVLAVDNVSFDLAEGKLLTLLGPSGSGKTTILNMVAGLEIPTSGEIWVKKRELSSVPPHKRGLGMVFQNYALFPHMTIQENIAFPLKMSRQYTKSEIEVMVREILGLVQLEGYGKRYPSQLSGGQRQRIALARALVFKPPLVLMDEPLGALDKKLRMAMQLEIKNIQQELGQTMIYVTHDQEEALTLADKIAIMNKGRIEQLDSPSTIYEYPANSFVADFIGESNILPVRVVQGSDAGVLLHVGSNKDLSFTHDGREEYVPSAGEEMNFILRPEKVRVGKDLTGPVKKLSGTVKDVLYLGEYIKYLIALDDHVSLVAKKQTTGTEDLYDKGEVVDLSWPDANCRLLRKS